MNTGSVMGKVGKFKVCFRDEQLTSHAGVVLVHELAERLGAEQIVDEELQVKQRERGYSEGQAVGHQSQLKEKNGLPGLLSGGFLPLPHSGRGSG